MREQGRCRKWPVSRHYDGMSVKTEALHNRQLRRSVLGCAMPCNDSPALYCGSPLSIPEAVCMGFVADNRAMELVFSEYIRLPLSA
jgi:hypothetical protein